MKARVTYPVPLPPRNIRVGSIVNLSLSVLGDAADDIGIVTYVGIGTRDYSVFLPKSSRSRYDVSISEMKLAPVGTEIRLLQD